jgi:hypothetical protein
MRMQHKTHFFQHIPVQLPRKEIYSRLGYNFHLTRLTPEQQQLLERLIDKGFRLCSCRGVWKQLAIEIHHPQIVTEDGYTLNSESLAALLEGCRAMLVMAATAGRDIGDMAAHFSQDGDGVAALVYDAVGSETADAALDWINLYLGHQYTRKGEQLTGRRYSPGYGDLDLGHQRYFAGVLELEKLDVRLTDSCMLDPEKSVIGLAGIGRLPQS